MQVYSTYSVISPESCASILWSDSSLAEKASEKLKMSPTELLKMGIIDEIIAEPKGGAHRDWTKAAAYLKQSIAKNLNPLIKTSLSSKKSTKKLMMARTEKFRLMGQLGLTQVPQENSTPL